MVRYRVNFVFSITNCSGTIHGDTLPAFPQGAAAHPPVPWQVSPGCVCSELICLLVYLSSLKPEQRCLNYRNPLSGLYVWQGKTSPLLNFFKIVTTDRLLFRVNLRISLSSSEKNYVKILIRILFNL